MLLKSPVLPYKQTSKLSILKASGQSNRLKSKNWVSLTLIVDTYKRYTYFYRFDENGSCFRNSIRFRKDLLFLILT